MPIDKRALFESTKALWPIKIEMIRAPDTLNDLYRANETAFPVDDDWRQVAIWSFHQALGGLEERALARGASSFSPHAMDFAAFDTWMRFNLNGDECWAVERVEWEDG